MPAKSGKPTGHWGNALVAGASAGVRAVNPALGAIPPPAIVTSTVPTTTAKQPDHVVTAPRMNKTEERYAQRLRARYDAGDLIWWHFEPIKVYIGRSCWYRVDFMTITDDGVTEYHEVKGPRVWDDARVKFLAAVDLYPWARWVWARWIDGRWTTRTTEPTVVPTKGRTP